MPKTVVGLFRDVQDAETAVRRLETAGFTLDHVSIVAGNWTSEPETEAKTGVARGAAVGGGIGLVAGLMALAVPGIGPVLAGGSIVAALTGIGVGAAAGGVIGGFSTVGIPEEEHGHYSERLRQGEVLVAVRAEDDHAAEAAQIMQSSGEREQAVRTYERSSEQQSDKEPSMKNDFDETTDATSRADVRRDDPSGAWQDSDDAYRAHYEQRYGYLGRDYNYYAPAYTLGSMAATGHSGRQWDEVEPEMRRDWESHGKGAWDEFKEAVRHGWDKVRGTVTNTAR